MNSKSFFGKVVMVAFILVTSSHLQAYAENSGSGSVNNVEQTSEKTEISGKIGAQSEVIISGKIAIGTQFSFSGFEQTQSPSIVYGGCIQVWRPAEGEELE